MIPRENMIQVMTEHGDINRMASIEAKSHVYASAIDKHLFIHGA